jgi:hypothetical protein
MYTNIVFDDSFVLLFAFPPQSSKDKSIKKYCGLSVSQN